MNASRDNLGEQIKIWTSKFAEKVGIITKAAATKAEELSKVGKLKMDIYQLQRERNRLYAELGKIAYKTLEGKGEVLENQSGVVDLRQRIAGITKQMEEKEREIEQASRVEEPVSEEAPVEAKTAAEGEAPKAKPAAATAGSGKKEKAATTKETGAKKTAKQSGAD
ncbi:MAG: hypothetical protein ACETWG_05270 [Candidatus Neomarinimicrobiota bacterium]